DRHAGVKVVLSDIVCERPADLRDGLNSHNPDGGVNRAGQNRVYAAVRAHVDEATGVPDVFEDYWSGLLFPFPQTRPEYALSNSVEIGGKPLASPSGAVYCKRLECPPPGQELSRLRGHKSTLTGPNNRSTKG